MQGASRESFAALRIRLTLRELGHASADQVERESQELLAVAALLGHELQLRGSLADPATPEDARAQLARAVLGGRLSDRSVEIVAEAARGRWSRPADLADVLEQLGVEAAFTRAEAEGRLDRIEDELFRVGRLVDAQPDLRRALSDPGVPVEARRSLLRTLRGERVDPTTLALLEHLVGSLRGRRLEAALEQLVSFAAVRRAETLAEVTVAAPLTAEQEQRLVGVLERIYSTRVRVQVQVDPDVLGGVVVRVGDEVVDGTILHRIEQARRTATG
jgi:F-type H+-transporting ATPase subunit delta